MNYLYERQAALRKEERELLKICFNSKGNMKALRDVQARLDEINKAIREIEHE